MRVGDYLRSVRDYFLAEKEAGVGEYVFSSGSAGKIKDDIVKELKDHVLRCDKCALAKSRHNAVFGAGNVNARLMFVGEAPGYDEDMKGEPFVGKAGMLLTKIIEVMGFKREDVYICNILKCRPEKNRNPLPTEIARCIGYLHKQIELIHPSVICGLGKFASQTLLNTEISITKLRGHWYEYKGIKFMPTYHPAYLLRNPRDKKLVWEDMKKIMKEL